MEKGNDKDVFSVPSGRAEEVIAAPIPEFVPFAAPTVDASAVAEGARGTGRDWLQEMKPDMGIEPAQDTEQGVPEAAALSPAAKVQTTPPEVSAPANTDEVPGEVVSSETIQMGTEETPAPAGGRFSRKIISYIFRPKPEKSAVAPKPASRKKRAGAAVIILFVATAAVYLVFGDTGNVLTTKDSKPAVRASAEHLVPAVQVAAVVAPVMKNMSGVTQQPIGVAPSPLSAQSSSPGAAGTPTPPDIQTSVTTPALPSPQAKTATPAAGAAPDRISNATVQTVKQTHPEPVKAALSEKSSGSDDDYLSELAKLRKQKILAQYRSEIAKFEREARGEKEGASTRALPALNDVIPPPIPGAKNKAALPPVPDKRGKRYDAPVPEVPAAAPDAEVREEPLPALLAVNGLSRVAVVQVNGAIINVHEGEMIGEYVVTRIGSGAIVISRDKKNKTVYLAARGAKKSDKDAH